MLVRYYLDKLFQNKMPIKVTIELIVDNEAFYNSGTDENIENYIIEIQKLTKTFSYVRECNIVCIVREGEKK
jgi:hypothetical protein